MDMIWINLIFTHPTLWFFATVNCSAMWRCYFPSINPLTAEGPFAFHRNATARVRLGQQCHRMVFQMVRCYWHSWCLAYCHWIHNCAPNIVPNLFVCVIVDRDKIRLVRTIFGDWNVFAVFSFVVCQTIWRSGENHFDFYLQMELLFINFIDTHNE